MPRTGRHGHGVVAAPALVVLVCENGAGWLPDALAALRALNPRPSHVVAVDSGSTDTTPRLLTAALGERLVDGVLTMPAGTGVDAAVRAAALRAEQRWGDATERVWLLTPAGLRTYPVQPHRRSWRPRRPGLPVLALICGLALVALVVHRGRLGLDLSGGRLAPSLGLAQTWSQYLSEWHPVLGGTAAPAPASLAVLGVLGAVFALVGGPAAAASMLLLGAMPLAGGVAYFATRRLAVPRWGRALAAAAYALLPVGWVAAGEGRLDVVVAHVLLPAVLAGVVGLLAGWSLGSDAGARRWLPSACATALGLAVISAFAPVVHVLVLILVLVGFVLIPGRPGQAVRRLVALFAVVLLPLGLLLPWPAVVVQHPSVLLHGVGAVVPHTDPLPTPWALVAVGIGALLVVASRPRRTALTGLAVAVIGVAAALVVSSLSAVPLPGGAPQPGHPGAPLLLAGAGLLWAALVAVAGGCAGAEQVSVWQQRFALVVTAAVVGSLAGGALLLGGAGPVRADRPRLAEPLQQQVAAARTSVLVVSGIGEPVRAAVGRLPALGDDDLAPVATAPVRMARWAAAFGSGQPSIARLAVLDAAASGIELVVLPDQAAAETLLTRAGELVTSVPPTSEGRPVVRLLPLARPVVVLAPQVADMARTGAAPPADYGASGVVAVSASPPALNVEIGGGAVGRLVVVAAEMEDGWRASVGDRPVRVTRAWGHLVGVPLPAEAALLRLERSSAVRAMLLLVQLAVALFTVITAVPAGVTRA